MNMNRKISQYHIIWLRRQEAGSILRKIMLNTELPLIYEKRRQVQFKEPQFGYQKLGVMEGTWIQ